MKKISLLLLVLLAFVKAYATHNRAGEITYTHISGYTYEIKIVTCTKTSVIADRDYLKIDWGDIQQGAPLDSLDRTSIFFFQNIDAQRNEYVGRHTYAGPGVYELTVVDPNRNGGVLNIDNSVTVPFCLISELVISPDVGLNNSVVLLNPPKEQACINKKWVHNPAAFDPDGDFLRYSLVPCRGDSCKVIPGYKYPDESTPEDDSFTINSETGDIVWEFPSELGEYNIAILIEEFRRNAFGELVFVGSVVRDMQIEVINCSNNPPVIDSIPDVCVVAGDFLSQDVHASDPDYRLDCREVSGALVCDTIYERVFLAALGGPFFADPPATFFSIEGDGTFSWRPSCSAIQIQDHFVYFKATDLDNRTPLTDIYTWRIKVIAPPVTGVQAEALTDRVTVSWNDHECAADLGDFFTSQLRYKVYRRIGEATESPGECETGMPNDWDYELLAEIKGDEVLSFDDMEVEFGNSYCYRIVACWPDGSESIVSNPNCAYIEKFSPVITRVSIDSTSDTDGIVDLVWSPPSAIDTTIFLPPYQYKVYHRVDDDAFGENPVYSSTLGAVLNFGDTSFVHLSQNTLESIHHYRVDFYSQGVFAVSSEAASSPYLIASPTDKGVELTIQSTVPWTNTQYNIYREDDLGVFNLIGSSDSAYYLDSGLINYEEYCYYVETVGEYGHPQLPSPLLNLSQESCAIPFDNVAPCAPQLAVFGDCESFIELSWNNPNNSCADDVTMYKLYYKSSREGDFEEIFTFNSQNDTVATLYLDDLNQSLAGCFVITALDSILPNPNPGEDDVQNESEFSNVVCTDNCPLYTLPNIFSPNGDGSNDYFRPFYVRFVESINCNIYNRWGTLVFHTKDPEILWDGRNMESGNMSSDGVYYYIIKVNTIKLEGIESFELNGSLQLVGGESNFSD